MGNTLPIKIRWENKLYLCDLTKDRNLTGCRLQDETVANESISSFALVQTSLSNSPIFYEHQSPWVSIDRTAIGLQTAAFLLLLIPEPTVTKIAGVILLVSSAYMIGRGAAKIAFERKYVSGGYYLFLGLAGGRFGWAAKGGRIALKTFWKTIPKAVQWVGGGVIVYPFGSEMMHGCNQKIRTEVYAPLITGSPIEHLFPSMEGVNALDYYQIQIEQDQFRTTTALSLKQIASDVTKLKEMIGEDQPALICPDSPDPVFETSPETPHFDNP